MSEPRQPRWIALGQLTRVRDFTRRDVDRWAEWGRHADPLFSSYNPTPMSGAMRDSWFDDLVNRHGHQIGARTAFRHEQIKNLGGVDPADDDICPSVQKRRNAEELEIADVEHRSGIQEDRLVVDLPRPGHRPTHRDQIGVREHRTRLSAGVRGGVDDQQR